MRIIVYADKESFRKLRTDRDSVAGLLHRIAEGTDTEGLVVTISLQDQRKGWGGAFYPGDMVRGRLRRLRGPWRKAHAGGIPPGLPDKFRLIEVNIGSRNASYPCKHMNRNGFNVSLKSFDAHLAYIFAHELHHYRKHCLDLHPHQGEKGADRWAAARACELGFDVTLEQCNTMVRRLTRRRRRAIRPASESAAAQWATIRGLPKGAILQLARSDNRAIPAGSILSFVRPMRGSYRVLVRTADGSDLCVPMDWLRMVS